MILDTSNFAEIIRDINTHHIPGPSRKGYPKTLENKVLNKMQVDALTYGFEWAFGMFLLDGRDYSGYSPLKTQCLAGGQRLLAQKVLRKKYIKHV